MIVFKEVLDVARKLTIADIPLLIAHLIASLVMLFCLGYLVYQPFKKWISARENKLKDDFNKTQSLLTSAQKKEQLVQAQLQKAQKLAKQLLADANNRSLEEKKHLLEEGERLRQQLLDDAKLEVVNIHKDAKKTIEKSIVLSAVQLSEKLLLASLDKDKHDKLIQDFVKSLDEQ